MLVYTYSAVSARLEALYSYCQHACRWVDTRSLSVAIGLDHASTLVDLYHGLMNLNSGTGVTAEQLRCLEPSEP